MTCKILVVWGRNVNRWKHFTCESSTSLVLEATRERGDLGGDWDRLRTALGSDCQQTPTGGRNDNRRGEERDRDNTVTVSQSGTTAVAA